MQIRLTVGPSNMAVIGLINSLMHMQQMLYPVLFQISADRACLFSVEFEKRHYESKFFREKPDLNKN
jgi:hypothetical protein